MKQTARLIAAWLVMLSHGLLIQGQEQKKADYSVHEWGVFTAPRNAEWLKQDMLREWQSFPEFFQGVLPERGLLYRGPVTKPVIFFHGERTELTVDLTIHFKTGQPLIWWPPVEFPADGSFGMAVPEPIKDAEPYSVIRYGLTLAKDNGERRAVREGHWLRELRKVKALPFSVYGSASNRIHPDNNLISESFIYYDGLMKPPEVPSVTRAENGISLETDIRHDCHDVYVIERHYRTGDISVGYVDTIKKGKQKRIVELERMDIGSFKELVPDRLKKQLVNSGLNDDEADSLIAVWNDGLFRRTGVTLFYRISQSTYDEWIPLFFNPEPNKIVRVGLVVHHHLEPELDKAIEDLITELGSDDFEVRANADKMLREIGGAAIPAIEKIADQGDPESRIRAKRILNSLKTDDLLEQIIKKRAEK